VTVDEIRSWCSKHIREIRWRGEEGKGHCPLHDDEHASLSVNVEKAIWNCLAGCGGGTLRQLAERAGWGWPFNGSGRREVARYGYKDAEGKLLFEVVRFQPKKFRHYNPNTRTWTTKGIRRVPYRLPELLEAINSGRHIFVVEGEKDVETLRKLALAATCNPGGVGGARLWRDFAQHFQQGSKVILVPDADEPGQKLMDEVAAELLARGCELRRFDLGYPITKNHGKDISDWIAEGHTRDELIERANKAATVELNDIAKSETEEPPANSPQAPTKKKSQATILVELVRESNAELFHCGEDCYVTFANGGHYETSGLHNARFRKWLKQRFFEEYQSVPGAQALQDAIGVLEGFAQFKGKEISTQTRIAPDGAEGLYIDLGDESWDAVHVMANGYYEKVSDPPVRFVRPSGQKALPPPEPGGSIDKLREFWNVSDEQFYIAVVFLLQAMRPEGPYGGLEVDGEQGSGKTFFVRTTKEIVDPNMAPVRSAPKDEVDLIIAARGSRLPCFDNLSYLNAERSDALCRMSTGSGIGKRTLYSDLDETIAWVQRPFILNGINPIASRGDLLDRLFRITLKAIPEEERKTPSEYWASWNQSLPRILGAVFDAMAKTLAVLPTIPRPARLPRMADVALFGVAVERALYWPAGSFLAAYDKNIRASDEETLESSPVSDALNTAIATEFTGTMTGLLELLEQNISESTRKSREWPKDAPGLGKTLRRLLPNLARIGWNIEIDEKARPRRIRIIRENTVGADATDGAAQIPGKIADSRYQGTDEDGGITVGSTIPASNTDGRGNSTDMQKSSVKRASDSADSTDSKIPIRSNDLETEQKALVRRATAPRTGGRRLI
jgi:5S rRNA maturation endonuclease (ribonuclease M5)